MFDWRRKLGDTLKITVSGKKGQCKSAMSG